MCGEADSNKLHAWLAVIALGKKVRTKDSEEIRFKSALQDSYTLTFSNEFGRKHPDVVRWYQSYATREGSAWEAASTAPATKGALDAIHVETKDDFRRWLISARRLESWAGVGVGGVKVQRGATSRYGRETVSSRSLA